MAILVGRQLTLQAHLFYSRFFGDCTTDVANDVLITVVDSCHCRINLQENENHHALTLVTYSCARTLELMDCTFGSEVTISFNALLSILNPTVGYFGRK